MATQFLQVNVLLLTYLWVFPRSAWLYKVRSECQSDSNQSDNQTHRRLVHVVATQMCSTTSKALSMPGP